DSRTFPNLTRAAENHSIQSAPFSLDTSWIHEAEFRGGPAQVGSRRDAGGFDPSATLDLLMPIAGIDEFIHIFVQLVVLFFVDVHHVSRFVIGEADVLTYRRFEIHVLNGVFNTIERRCQVVVSGHYQ